MLTIENVHNVLAAYDEKKGPLRFTYLTDQLDITALRRFADTLNGKKGRVLTCREEYQLGGILLQAEKRVKEGSASAEALAPLETALLASVNQHVMRAWRDTFTRGRLTEEAAFMARYDQYYYQKRVQVQLGSATTLSEPIWLKLKHLLYHLPFPVVQAFKECSHIFLERAFDLPQLSGLLEYGPETLSPLFASIVILHCLETPLEFTPGDVANMLRQSAVVHAVLSQMEALHDYLLTQENFDRLRPHLAQAGMADLAKALTEHLPTATVETTQGIFDEAFKVSFGVEPTSPKTGQCH